MSEGGKKKITEIVWSFGYEACGAVGTAVVILAALLYAVVHNDGLGTLGIIVLVIIGLLVGLPLIGASTLLLIFTLRVLWRRVFGR